MPSGIAVSASPTLWIRSANRAIEPDTTNTIACNAAVVPRIARLYDTARTPSRERTIERSTRPWL